MWETIKNDPLLKTIVVIVLGILSFGFAFNVMFGSRSGMSGGEMGGEMMGGGSGSSFSNALGIILAMLIKLVIIAALIGVLIWIIQIIRKYLATSAKDQNIKIDLIKNEPVVKGFLVVIAVVIVISVMYTLFRGPSAYVGQAPMMNGAAYYTAYGFGFGGNSIVALLARLLIFISIVGLGIGITMYVKESHLKNVKNSEIETLKCPNCNTNLKADWKCCPSCGSEKAFTKAETPKGEEV